MSEHFDAVAAKQRYTLLDDVALVKIAYGSKVEYLPEAVALAREELNNRGVAESDGVVISTIATEQSEPLQKDQDLAPALKALCFILTPIPSLLIAGWQLASGRRRAAKQALAWTLYGLLTWMALVVAFAFLSPHA